MGFGVEGAAVGTPEVSPLEAVATEVGDEVVEEPM